MRTAISLLITLITALLLIVAFDFIRPYMVESPIPKPKFEVGEHIVLRISNDEAIVLGENGYDDVLGWTLKIKLLKSNVTIKRINENKLLKKEKM